MVYRFNVGDVSFDWAKIKRSRDTYIARLNGIYESGLDKLNIKRVAGTAVFVDEKTVHVEGVGHFTADHICIAVGGKPKKLGIPGSEHMIDSNGFFALETQPKKVAVIGAGYIAVELAGVFNGLGTDTSLFVRQSRALRTFDTMIVETLHQNMTKSGLKVQGGSVPKEVVKESDGSLTLHLENGESFSGFDCILEAIGREPVTHTLALENTGVTVNAQGFIETDAYQNTSQSGVSALGDVCGKVELTPMAIAAGRRLGDRIHGGILGAKADYEFVPTVVFSHPVIGTCGYTEAEATEKYGAENLKIYNSSFVNLHYGIYFDGGVGDKPISKVKIICFGPDERVVGLHLIGMGSDEVLQGFGVAMKMGATKADFDNCIAIHPTAAEEVVTCPPWGLSGKQAFAAP
jgi:glutathione reductase (NADPH)